MGGIFSSFGAMSGQFAAKQERGQVAKALVEELQQPGKLDSLVQELERNAPALLEQWTGGSTEPMPVAEVQKSLGKYDLLTSLVQRTNMPPGVVKSSLAVLLPIAMHHLATGRQAGAAEPKVVADPQALLEDLQ